MPTSTAWPVTETAAQHAGEVATGERFEFGENWRRFLEQLDEERIAAATAALADMLETDSLAGKTFLDVGSGSGLMSLAALRLGAERVKSFDYDPSSVAATTEVRRRFAGDAGDRWTVESGSALDTDYLAGLGTWDVVYSWGVLHHTGDMYAALGNVVPLVAPGGRLFVAIYTDQGLWSRMWHAIKRVYNKLPAALRKPYVLVVIAPFELKAIAGAATRGELREHFRAWRGAKDGRGMSVWYDMVDWVGGYPFEVATPEAIFDFYRVRGFTLRRMTTIASGWGCNEFVFERVDAGA